MVVTPAVIVTPAKAGVQSVFRSLFSVFLFSVLCFPFSIHASSSLSDLAVEGLEREFVSTGGRNPFTPAEKGEMDAATLVLEGLVYSKTVRIGLLSGQVVRLQDKVGRYTVSKIEPGEVVLTAETEEQRIRMEGYLKPQNPGTENRLSINFRQADIKDALRLLSTAADYNLIAPEDISGRVNVSFENTTLRDAISAILKVNGYNYAIESGIMRVGKPDQFAGGTDLLATAISLKYATAGNLVDKVKPLLSDKGSVTAEDRTNTLSVKDYEANVDSVRKFVEHVDKKDQQVLIEAHIIDATNNFSRSLGVQWGISGNPSKLTVSGASNTGNFTINGFPPTPAIVNLPAANPTGGVGFRVGQLPGATNIDLQLTAAEQRGDIRIISKPNVSTINNLPAKIRSGVKIYVKSTSNISVGTPGAEAEANQPSLQLIETGVQLTVTPQISPESMIKLTIDASESQPNFAQAVDGIPSILDNTATTTVLLHDSETAVIGGLIKTNDSYQKNSVPGLSKIPVLGLFFQNKTKSKTYSELMVFITPKILK